MVNPFFPRGVAVYAPEMGSGSGGPDHSPASPGQLTRHAGHIARLLMRDEEEAKAKIYFEVYGQSLPFASVPRGR